MRAYNQTEQDFPSHKSARIPTIRSQEATANLRSNQFDDWWLKCAGPNEAALVSDQAIQVSGTWAPFFGRLRHLGMQCTNSSTLAICICLCFSSSLTSLSLSGGPSHNAIHALKQELSKCSAADMRDDAIAGVGAGAPSPRPTLLDSVTLFNQQFLGHSRNTGRSASCLAVSL